MSTTRNFFVGGNWKMNGCKSAIDTIVAGLNATEVPSETGKCWGGGVGSYVEL